MKLIDIIIILEVLITYAIVMVLLCNTDLTLSDIICSIHEFINQLIQ